MNRIGNHVWRVALAVAGVCLITVVASWLIPVNATTSGFAYLLFVLIVASTWGFLEAAIASMVATVLLNFFFFPPVGTLTIADPQNWVALFSFLTSSLIASRLSAVAKRQARDAQERQQDVERLYTFSRAMLLIESVEAFPQQLAQRLADVFSLGAVVLYDRRSDQFYRAGPMEFDGMEEQLKASALQGTSFQDPLRRRLVTAVRLGSQPIASLALQGNLMPDSVLQGIGNLVAIGLERAQAQSLAHQVAAAQQTERLRTTLIDAMAHEFKTPLTSIRAATTSLISDPHQPEPNKAELIRIADEEAQHLTELIDNALELARIDQSHLDVHVQASDLGQTVREVVSSMHAAVDGRPVNVNSDSSVPPIPIDRRLMKLAIKQVLDNALKYSPPSTPVDFSVRGVDGTGVIEITDYGKGILPQEQPRIFQRFYRSPATEKLIPGSGLGLSIAQRILEAHNGDLTVTSEPGKTTFRMTLPLPAKEVAK